MKPAQVVLWYPPPPIRVPLKTSGRLDLIAFDPGGTTGWSHIVLPSNVFETSLESVDNSLISLLGKTIEWTHGQIDCTVDDEDLGTYFMRKFLDEWPSAGVVIEDFNLRYLGVDLSPVTVTANLKHHLWLRGRTFVKQQPSMGKRMNDERLKELGVHTSLGGLQHARDADRHIVMFLRRCLEGSRGKVLRESVFGK